MHRRTRTRTRTRIRTPRLLLGVTAAALIAGAMPVAAQAHTTINTPVHQAALPSLGIPPQQNVPELDAPGEPKTITYSPDNRARRGPGTFTVTAPAHTRITALDMRCISNGRCSVAIAADGSTATARLRPGRWTYSSPVQVHVQALTDAPLNRAEYTGTFDVAGETQPLTVVITEGKQGGLGLTSKDAPGGKGALVATTVPGGPADTVGIRVGDTITSVNNTPVTNAAELRAARIGKLRSGATVPLTYRQPNGTTRTTEVTLT
ncbi:PDZ domain-containing protein [Streptomyces sp. NPDC051662]|uniref:PDZ domain-containing protein n=1 Tax=Streptomyces sp. NPDC051662 TaxID=3154750 RepID=UPI003414D21B